MSELKKISATLTILAFPKSETVCSFLAEGESKYYTYLSSHDYTNDPADSGHIVLGTVDVDYEVPTDDMYYDMEQIKVLQAKKQALIAKSRMEQQQIDNKIAALTALEHLPQEE